MANNEGLFKKMAISMIEVLREYHNFSWEEIKKLDSLNENQTIQSIKNSPLFVNEIWEKLVDDLINDEQFGTPAALVSPTVMIETGQNFDYKLDESRGSAWNAYFNTLRNNGFKKDTIENIQTSAHKILNKLSMDTTDTGPIKGLVIGNVQSGKTANMAALMAMAADQGWNLFIILSGTIDNLRIQTQNRLNDDLKSATDVAWTLIDNVNTDKDYAQALSKLSLSSDNKQRYITVCLKNSKRLENLLSWLSKDTKAREKLKILIIDDEADQAGINTAKVSKTDQSEYIKERTKINKLIVNLLNNKDEFGRNVSTKFKSINYVAYTATPYANILNEKPSAESTYPSNFVACLSVPNTYFGPQHIFGLPGTNCDGLNIINKIADNEIKIIKSNDIKITKGLEQAILWFYCCVAIMRLRKSKKPISMLIHISQKQDDHRKIADLIKRWKKSIDNLEFINKCKIIYETQKNMLSLDAFYESYKNYEMKIEDYPNFNDISNILLDIYNKGLNSIVIDEKGDPCFSEGINLCIDNCSNIGLNNVENEHIRLLYPDKNQNLDYNPGFIVIGGATLSRGLTIEGLVSSYFLRTVNQSDTLMQMARWFGYRHGYELLPRIWLDEKTIQKFEFLSSLDAELRQEMKNMEDLGLSPEKVGIKIKTHPKSNFLRITAANKQKDAKNVDIDYGGIATQTTMFYSDEDKLKHNLEETIDFIKKLKKVYTYTINNNNFVFKKVSDSLVLEYLKNMKFPKNDNTFIDLKFFDKWMTKISEEKQLDEWNILLSGKGDTSNYFIVDDLKIGKVNRSKKKNTYNDDFIRIGALRTMKDVYGDVNIDDPIFNENDIKLIKKYDSEKFRYIRKKAGLSKTPLLIIYCIDKDSKKRENAKDREDLNLNTDVIGLMLIIPDGNGIKNNYVSINLSAQDLEDYGDDDDEN